MDITLAHRWEGRVPVTRTEPSVLDRRPGVVPSVAAHGSRLVMLS